MPWKECSVVDERLRFVAQLLDGEAMSEVCRAFGISRKTGYKIFERYKEHGLSPQHRTRAEGWVEHGTTGQSDNEG
jgi:transposase